MLPKAMQLLRQIAANEPIVNVDGAVDFECGFCHETADADPTLIAHDDECLWFQVRQFIAEEDADD